VLVSEFVRFAGFWVDGGGKLAGGGPCAALVVGAVGLGAGVDVGVIGFAGALGPGGAVAGFGDWGATGGGGISMSK
jgi:hypothetical protein